MYYSTTKNRCMEPREMHMMHLENVLLKDLKEGTLDWETTNELTDAYITKTREERERLHKLVKSAVQVNRLLMDLTMTSIRQKPTTPPLHLRTPILEFYRQVALGYIRKHGRISADQLRRTLEKSGYTVHGQALTHVFRDDRFQQVSYRRSSWGGAKGRFINVWKAA